MITSLIGEQLIYVKKYIFCKISVFNKVWYNFMEKGNWECTGKKKYKNRVLHSFNPQRATWGQT
jgi:hypothetical protein